MAPFAYKSTRTFGKIISVVLEWGIRLLLIVMACWLYALTTAALMKYLGS